MCDRNDTEEESERRKEEEERGMLKEKGSSGFKRVQHKEGDSKFRKKFFLRYHRTR